MGAAVRVFTMGFTKKSAEVFFSALRDAGVRRVVDVRLNNISQLAGFAKRDDLRFFLREMGGIDYVHRLDLAPTPELLAPYVKRHEDWDTYRSGFLELMRERRIEETIPQELFEDSCLLCSEDQPHRCHRRLVAEYLQGCWGDLDIVHLPLPVGEAATGRGK